MKKLFTLLFYLSSLLSQSIQISGLIIDNQTKLPVSDVNILVTNSGATSNIEGKFLLLGIFPFQVDLPRLND